MRRLFPGPFLLASLSLLASPVGSQDAGGQGALLPLGETREVEITADATHVYRVAASPLPVLVTVEQRGIDLIVEARGPEPAATSKTDAPNERWGPELLLLPGGGGEYSLEVRSLQRDVAPGRYTLRLEALPAGTSEEEQRREAWTAMSRAVQIPTNAPQEQRQEAVAAYRDALATWRRLGDRRAEAEALTAAAIFAHETGDLRRAIEQLEQVAPLWQELGDRHREAAVTNWLGAASLDAGETAKARPVLESAIALWDRLGERYESLKSRSNLCVLEQNSGDLYLARDCFEELRRRFLELGDKSQEPRLLHSLGGIHQLLGEPDAALAHYGEALALQRAAGDRLGEVKTLNNVAVIHRTLGEWQEAVRVYELARQVLAPLARRQEEAKLLHNLGFAYADLGDLEHARVFFEEALELFREVGDSNAEVIARRNLGGTLLALGEPQKALGHYRTAFARATALGDPRQVALTRLALGEYRLEQGDPRAALDEIAPALAVLKEAGLRAGELQALWLEAHARGPREALPVLQKILERSREQRDGLGEALALQELAATERRVEGLAAQARRHAEEAVTRMEELRTGFVSPSLRAAFFASQSSAAALLIDIQMERHAAEPAASHDQTALAISEQTRAKSLLDALYAGNTAHAAPAGLVQRRRSLRYLLSLKVEELLRSREGPANPALDAGLEREAANLETALHAVEAEIRQHDPDYAAYSRQQPIAVREIAGLLDPGTLFLEYSLGEEQSFLWAVGAAGIRSYVLPSRAKIEDLARRVHKELRTVEPGASPSADRRALSRILLEKVWSETAALQRLVVVPDGALHLIPWSALQVPAPGKPWGTSPGNEKPLLEYLDVTYLPSATTLALERKRRAGRPKAAKGVAVFADPVFDPNDPRLGPPVAGGPPPSFDRLSASRHEAEAIFALAPAGQVRSTLGVNASREAVLSGELGSYRILHFATHAVADLRHPDSSGLVLSLVDERRQERPGFVSVSDVYELDLAAELVVLSGCETALGKEVRGEGLMGLTRGFLHAGVPRVVASLWRVQDRKTAELMQHFYRAMLRDGKTAATALYEAQLALRRKYRDPYYWAGFVLQGDWR